ncbi:hypothetical protein AKJ16_DCAP02731 [Drosera capensis]
MHYEELTGMESTRNRACEGNCEGIWGFGIRRKKGVIVEIQTNKEEGKSVKDDHLLPTKIPMKSLDSDERFDDNIDDGYEMEKV